MRLRTKGNGQGAKGAFTLIEIMLAMALIGLVLGAIYSTWAAIVKASRVGQNAAAQAQRDRMAMRTLEEALASAQMFAANVGYYGFSNESSSLGGGATLSFVARLPESFPRSGKFGDYDVRRVTFSVEAGGDGGLKRLLLRQNPIFMEMDEDEKAKPVILAQNVKSFSAEFWDDTTHDWIEEWTQTNQFPKMVKVSLQLGYASASSRLYSKSAEMVTRVVSLPTAGVPQAWELPTVTGTRSGNAGGGSTGGGNRGAVGSGGGGGNGGGGAGGGGGGRGGGVRTQ
jgi:type II secretion system protein J